MSQIGKGQTGSPSRTRSSVVVGREPVTLSPINKRFESILSCFSWTVTSGAATPSTPGPHGARPRLAAGAPRSADQRTKVNKELRPADRQPPHSQDNVIPDSPKAAA